MLALEKPPGQDPPRIDWCVIEERHHRRGKACRLVCRAGAHDPAGNHVQEQLFFGRLHPLGGLAEAPGATRARSLMLPERGPAAFSLPMLRLEMWAYPNDPDLPGLSVMLDRERLLAAMKARPSAFGLLAPPSDVQAELVKYVPGKRAGVKLHVTSAAGADPAAIYGRACRDRAGEHNHRVLTNLWESAPRRAGAFQIPRPLGYDDASHIVWQEALSGLPIGKHADLDERLPRLTAAIGESLAALHDASLDVPSKGTLGSLAEDLSTALSVIGETYPEHAGRCAALAETLLATAPAAPGPRVCVHGSMKLDHLFETERGVAFIDLDGAGTGDAAYDLGCWVAHLHRLGAAGRVSASTVAGARTEFVESYLRRARVPIDRATVDWSIAAHLVGGAVAKAVKRMDPRFLDALLSRAEEVAGG